MGYTVSTGSNIAVEIAQRVRQHCSLALLVLNNDIKGCMQACGIV